MMPAPHPRPSHPDPAPHPRARRSAAAALCIVAAAAVLAAPSPARGQEVDKVSGSSERTAQSPDRAVLAQLGLDLAAIEQTTDVPLLWRAVRELVLPGRVSSETQHRILRRVWIADSDIANGSYVESESQ